MKKDWVDTLEERVQNVRNGVKEGVKRGLEATARAIQETRNEAAKPRPEPVAIEAKPANLPVTPEELPVVARMVVEIRSDGSRTMARGALEDVVTGERVQLEASGTSPMQLAASLASSLLSTPYQMGKAAGAFVRGRLGQGGRRGGKS